MQGAGTDYLGFFTDSRRWAEFTPRPDDIFVCTPPKSGTTLTQAMLDMLLTGSPDSKPGVTDRQPWIDNRFRDLDEQLAAAEAHVRRAFKSHTPLDGIPLYDIGTYLVIYRHPLDVHFSMRAHVANLPFAPFPFFFPVDDDGTLSFARFLSGGAEGIDCDAATLALILRHFSSFRAVADHPNVHLFHYADLCRDRRSAVRRMADVLGVTHDGATLFAIADALDFDAMKQKANIFAPGGGNGFWKSDTDFFASGSCGKWQGQLSDNQLAAYDRIMSAALSPADRLWLEQGGTFPL